MAQKRAHFSEGSEEAEAHRPSRYSSGNLLASTPLPPMATPTLLAPLPPRNVATVPVSRAPAADNEHFVYDEVSKTWQSWQHCGCPPCMKRNVLCRVRFDERYDGRCLQCRKGKNVPGKHAKCKPVFNNTFKQLAKTTLAANNPTIPQASAQRAPSARVVARSARAATQAAPTEPAETATATAPRSVTHNNVTAATAPPFVNGDLQQYVQLARQDLQLLMLLASDTSDGVIVCIIRALDQELSTVQQGAMYAERTRARISLLKMQAAKLGEQVIMAQVQVFESLFVAHFDQ